MQLWPKGLNRQILSLTLSVVMGASIIFGVIALPMFYQYSRKHVLEANLQVARLMSNEIDQLMSQAVYVSESVADILADRSLAGGEITALITPLLKVTNVFDVTIVLDKQGNVVASGPVKSDLVGRNLRNQPSINQVLQTGKTLITEPIYGNSGKNIIVIISPIKDRQGKISGAVSSSIELQQNRKFTELFKKNITETAMTVEVVSRNGKIIYHPDRSRIMKDFAQDRLQKEIRLEKSGTAEIDKVLVGWVPAKNLGWTVIVRYPEEIALGSFFFLTKLMIIAEALICIIVFLITLIHSQRIIRPLGGLLEGVKKVADGDYDFFVDVKTQNEIGILASAFNSMVSRTKEMRQSIIRQKEELEKLNTELEVMAITDGLTKLYNHRYFQDCLGRAISWAQLQNKSITLMILDIDYFKYYNDLFGHQAGDRLLEELARLLTSILGSETIVARYGGEEFTVILYDSENENGVKVAERIRSAVETYPFQGREQQPDGKITVSIGVASYPENANSKQELVRLADEALYKAKSYSRNKVELYFSVLDDLNKDVNKTDTEFIDSLKMLIRIINAKDKYTYGHSERVGKLAVRIAEKMGLPEDEIRIIKMGAFLHDVGKIEVSASILMKKGPITGEEYEVIKKHPIWGAKIIQAVDSLRATIPIIQYHHERYDGTGYPKGLRGDEIPLHARILTVADSFDAITTNRPYRQKKAVAEAVKEIKRNAGTQFDPEIVKIFLRVLDENDEQIG